MLFSPVFGLGAGWRLGATPQELNVTEYGISLLFKSIELAVRRV